MNPKKSNFSKVSDDSSLPERVLLSLPKFAICSALMLILFYWFAFGHLPFSKDPETWGQFGDYMGGLLNPIVSLFTLMVALSVFGLQKTELSETRKALNKQATLQAFFSLLQQHRELISDLQLAADTTERRRSSLGNSQYLEAKYAGRAAFSAVVSTLYPLHSGDQITDEMMVEWTTHYAFTAASAESFQSQLMFSCWYEGDPCGFIGLEKMPFPNSLEMTFGHVFRSIYQILKFAYHAEGLEPQEKRDLVNYLRAQMSEDEFVLYALTALTKIGEKSRGIAIAFNFFEDRMETIEWANSLKNLLSQSTENLAFANRLGFNAVK